MERTNTAKNVGESTFMNAYKPTLIVLSFDDLCVLCSNKMFSGEPGLWLGKSSGVIHEECYKNVMSKDINW